MDNQSRRYGRYEKLANDVSSLGRYGDTTMMHVNPLEVEVLDRLTPGGLSTNPDTGKKEAVWWMAPLIGALVGGGLGAATAKQRDMPMWKAILMGVGTGAATGAVTGGLGALMSPAATVPTTIAAETALTTPLVTAEVGGPLLSEAALAASTTTLPATTLPATTLPATTLPATTLPATTATGSASLPATTLADAGVTAEVGAPLFSDAALLNSQVMDDVAVEGFLGSTNMPDIPQLSVAGQSFPSRMSGELYSGLGEYLNEPMHGIAAAGVTDYALGYKKGDPWGSAFDPEIHDPYWADEVEEYDHSKGPYWA